MTVSAPHIVAH
uniref:Cl574_1 n=1 Tax=Arundo donax TaxID=35708 RepID=A0A0A9FXD0_ARUDO